jgi:uncharacterized protein (TIGR03437 family)
MRDARCVTRALAAVAAAALLVTPSQAYYHYVHFTGRNAPFAPQFEKFNLATLPNKTVTFFVNDQGPAVYAPGDSFGSLLGQVKQALAAWDSISTSDLRVAFGGLETASQPSTTPGGDVVFQDLPPGLLGLGGPTSIGTTIVGGTVILSNNTNKGAGPSYLENYFTTAVHEIGHALGLQHTWTSSAMSQDVIRNTTRARPFDADDVASINLLYGKDQWQASYGTISGTVTMNGGVSLASVVALSPTGPAISSLTNPDGSYRIEGIPPGNYLVYVHPLPPDAVPADGSGLRLPQDQNGNPFTASGPFGTQFYGGTTDPTVAATSAVVVSAGSVNTLNFTVQPRAAVPVYDIITQSFIDVSARTSVYDTSTAKVQVVSPAFVTATKSSVVVKIETGTSDTPVPQSATVLGGFGTVSGQYIYPFTDNNGYRSVALYMGIPLFAGTGPRHLVLNYGNDMYVLPQAVNLVPKPVPAITSVTPNSDGSVTVTGAYLGGDTRVFFDGLLAATTVQFSGNDQQGSLTVLPPAGTSGQTSVVNVFDGDGQNSTFLPGSSGSYTYAASGSAQINSVSLPSVAGPALAMVDVQTSNTSFVEGQVTLGFGTDDVTVKRVFVLGPNHIQANVSVAPGATLGASEVSLIAGFQVMAQPGAFQTLPAISGRPLVAGITNGNPSQQTVYPGSAVTLYGTNLTGAQVTLNDNPVQVTFTSPAQVNFLVPPTFQTGAAVLKVTNGGGSAYPVLMQIDVPPPTIVSVTNASGVPYDAARFASAQDVIDVVVTSLDPTVVNNPSRVVVTMGGLTIPVTIVSLPNNQFQLQFVMPQGFGGIPVPLAVVVDGSASQSFMLTVR